MSSENFTERLVAEDDPSLTEEALADAFRRSPFSVQAKIIAFALNGEKPMTPFSSSMLRAIAAIRLSFAYLNEAADEGCEDAIFGTEDSAVISMQLPGIADVVDSIAARFESCLGVFTWVAEDLERAMRNAVEGDEDAESPVLVYAG